MHKDFFTFDQISAPVKRRRNKAKKFNPRFSDPTK